MSINILEQWQARHSHGATRYNSTQLSPPSIHRFLQPTLAISDNIKPISWKRHNIAGMLVTFYGLDELPPEDKIRGLFMDPTWPWGYPR